MSTTPRQLAFDLIHRPALGAEDFFVGRSNQAALDMVDQWPHWPHWALVVIGPPRSGKTHLANVWRLKSNATRLRSVDVSDVAVAVLKTDRSLLVENLEAGVADEKSLFHLLNVAREEKLSILLTSRVAPGDLDIRLPDLRSRLRALPIVAIEPPDDLLLKAVLVKHFADRQLMVEPHVVEHLAQRMERSMEAAQQIVAAIDRRALAARRRVTRALAAEVLAELGREPNDD
jgi:chromosomal replication initiation ATPase DnaA